jgi:hypothetical protein
MKEGASRDLLFLREMHLAAVLNGAIVAVPPTGSTPEAISSARPIGHALGRPFGTIPLESWRPAGWTISGASGRLDDLTLGRSAAGRPGL